MIEFHDGPDARRTVITQYCLRELQMSLDLIRQPIEVERVRDLSNPAHIPARARSTYFEQLRAKVAETPGVTMTAISSNATPPRNGWNSRFEILGRPAVEQQMGSINLIGPGYFAALRIPLLEGRIWNEAENRNGGHLAVINRTLAQ